MGISSSSALRALALVIAGALFVPGSALAVEHQVDILLDLDDDATTGCTVTTVDGPFDGVEQILVTTVDTTSPPPAGTVTAVAIRDCTNPATDTFGPPASFDGGWPIGVDNGVGGRDVVETYFPLVSSVVASPTTVHLAVVVTDEFGGEQALLTTDDTPDGGPILLVVQALGVPDIPTLGEWGLILLALALAGASILLLGRRGTVAFGVALLLLATGAVWAAGGLDGLTGDWSASDQLASNGIGLFGKAAGGDLCFRVDVDLVVNTVPVADAQTVATDEDVPVVITLTGSDANGDSLTFAVAAGPANGSLGAITQLTPTSAEVTYTPAADFDGADSFTFTVNDGSASSPAATVSITVDPINDTPTADAQAVTTAEDTPVVITLTGSDVDGDSLTFAVATGPTNGTLGAITPIDATSAQVTYTPNGDFDGADSFTFTVDDGTVSSAAATVSITVDPANDAPVADAQAVTTDEDVPVVITLTGSDIDGDALTFAVATGPANGSLGAITQLTPTSAEVTYTPAVDFDGADSFTFTVNDGSATSPAATVSITVDPLNDTPTADPQAVTTDEDVPVVITLTGSDVDGDSLTFAIATGPTNGSLSAITAVDATSAQVTYTPAGDFNGADSFTFTVDDGTVPSAAATVSITVDPGNDAPVANAQAVTTDEDVPVVVTLTGSDVDGDSLTFAIATAPTNGTLGAVTQVTPTSAQVTYTPAGDFNGADSFTFTVDDGTTSSVAATVSITVDPVQDPPTANAQAVTTDEDVAVVVTLTGADLDGDSLTFAIATAPANGTLGAITQLTPTSAEVTYTPAADFNGADSFTFTVNDGTVNSAPALVSLTVDAVNDTPMADDQAVATNEDMSVSITLTGADVDGDALTFAIATGPTNGTLGAVTQVTPTSAEVTYTPDADFSGADSFTFTVNDGTVSSAAATVSITVNPVNDPPAANSQAVTTDEDTPTVIVLTGADVDGDSLTFAIGTAPSNGSLSAITPIDATSAQVTYTPAANFFGSDSFTFTVNDGTVSSGAATVSITINSVPDPPLAGNDAFSTVGNVELAVAEVGDGSTASGPAFVSTSGNVLANDSDPVEGSGITIVELQGDMAAPFVGTTTEGGSVTLLADGSFVYTPEAGDRNVVDSFTYVIQNGVGAQATGTVQITIVDELLWFVKNTDSGGTLRAAGLGDGTSSDPFSSLSDGGTMNDAEDVSTAGESILVFLGDGSTANQDQGITLEANQKLFGHSTATLLLGGITVQTPSPGARPKIDNVNVGGDGVTITDATGVEVTGLDIAGTDNAVQIRATVAGTFTADIHDNTISSAGGHGIDGRTTAGELRLALDDNTGITASGSGVLLDGTGGGALYVTSFGGNAVDGATAADGLSANAVIFDADPTTPGFEEVVAGATVIGSSGDPVAGDGLKLTAVKGDLHFTQLDVFNTGGVGIQGVGDTSGGTGFELSTAAGQVESTGDSHAVLLTDVGIDPGDDFLLTRIVSTGSMRGVELLRVLGGDFSIIDGGAASSLTSSGEAIRVEGGTSAVTFNGVSATRTTAGGAAIFGLNHTGSFVMTGGTITHTGGRVIDFDNMDGGSDFTGTTVGTSNHHGKRLVNSAGVHTLPAVVITTAPPAGVDALHLQNNTGTTNVGGLSATTSGSRGLFASNAGTLNLSGLTNQITTTGHSAVEMANTAIGGSGVTFSSISASNTGANEGIDLDTVSGATFQVTGTVTVNTTTGGAAGIDVASSSAPLTINAIDIDATAGAGIALTGNSGTVTINGGNIAGATGVAFDVNGGSGNVTYAGTINNTVDNAVEITGRATAGRTVTLSGNITHDNGAGGATNHIGIEVSGNSAGSTVLSGASKVIKSGTQNGVHLVSNPSHTIQLTGGGLDIDTTSGTGFNATGGGVVEAVGAGSSVATATGTALNVVSTNIGAGGLNFQSISAGTGASGPANGIVLNGTGALGGLTVNGTGTTDGSGGILQRTTGDAVVLTSTRNVTLKNMVIGDPAAAAPSTPDATNFIGGVGINMNTVDNTVLDNLKISRTASHGIHGTGVTNLAVSSSEMLNNGDGNDEHAMVFNKAVSLTENNLDGTVTITNTMFDAFHEDGIRIENFAGTLNMTVSGSTFANNDLTVGENGIQLHADGSNNTTLTVNGNTLFDVLSGNSIAVFSEGSTSVANLTVQQVTIEGSVVSTDRNAIGILLFAGLGPGSPETPILDFLINNVTINDAGATGISIQPNGQSSMRGTVSGNTINGTGSGRGIEVLTDDEGDGEVTISGNNVTNTAFNAIFASNQNTATMDVSIRSNTAAVGTVPPYSTARGGLTAHGIEVNVRETSVACLDIASNSSTGADGGAGFRTRQRDTSTFRLERFTGVGTSITDVQNFLVAQNTSGTASATVSTSYTGVADNFCDVP